MTTAGWEPKKVTPGDWRERKRMELQNRGAGSKRGLTKIDGAIESLKHNWMHNKGNGTTKDMLISHEIKNT
jgi:hypothetical protein